MLTPAPGLILILASAYGSSIAGVGSLVAGIRTKVSMYAEIEIRVSCRVSGTALLACSWGRRETQTILGKGHQQPALTIEQRLPLL